MNKNEQSIKELYEAIRKNDIDAVRKLLEGGVDVNPPKEYRIHDCSPLALAVDICYMWNKFYDTSEKDKDREYKKYHVVEMLLKYGANPNERHHGKTMLYLAIIRTRSKRLVELLLQYGASWNNICEFKKYDDKKGVYKTVFRIPDKYIPYDDLSKMLPNTLEMSFPKNSVEFLKENGWVGYGESEDMSSEGIYREKPCIVYTDTYSIEANMNTGWNHSFSSCRVLDEDRKIIDVDDEDEAKYIEKSMLENKKGIRYKYIESVGTYSVTGTYVREDYWEEFGSYRKRGRTSYQIIRMMAES